MKFHRWLRENRIRRMKTYEEIAQEVNADINDVIRWECGECVPDDGTVTKLQAYLGCGNAEENRPLMDPIEMHKWETYAWGFQFEYRQCMEEGKDAGQYKELFDSINAMPDGIQKTKMCEQMNEMIIDLPIREGYEFCEPSDLPSIRKALAPGWDAVQSVPENIEKRIYGAWLGRISGCLLGKTVEGMRTDELHPLLKESGNWPMHRYILSTDVTEDMKTRFKYPVWNRCFADRIECAPSDDDTNYVCLAKVLVDKYGRDFTSRDVADAWLALQPRNAYCTAERVAFINFVKGYMPPASAVWQNPYREWIGAQIRGDYFGYINPGNPAKAAEMAWRDAAISHVKNGIYGEMWVSAMIAQAAVEENLVQVIRAGLRQIPEKSRLHKAITGVIEDYANGVSEEACFKRIHEMFDEHNQHDWCHTISNAMIVAASLLYGGGDFGKSICLSVQAGFDTDCNGATVGSILGMWGTDAIIGEKWLEPLKGMLDTQIIGVGRVNIKQIAKETMNHLI